MERGEEKGGGRKEREEGKEGERGRVKGENIHVIIIGRGGIKDGGKRN